MLNPTYTRLASLLIALALLTGCDTPARFTEPLGPPAYDLWDERLEGAWSISMQSFDEGEAPPPEGYGIMGFNLLLTHDGDGGIIAQAKILAVDTPEPDPAERRRFSAVSSVENYVGYPVRVGDAMLLNLRNVSKSTFEVTIDQPGGPPNVEESRAGYSDPVWLVARLRLLDSGNLEIAMVF